MGGESVKKECGRVEERFEKSGVKEVERERERRESNKQILSKSVRELSTCGAATLKKANPDSRRHSVQILLSKFSPGTASTPKGGSL